MHIAIEGCSHGELEVIYSTILHAQRKAGIKVDLLICCGDFQSVRNTADLKCMAVPTKYMQMQTFHKYYSGEKVAPILTIFIGGNHEASNYLQELPYGGWVAPNIYYLGYGGVINVGGLRIGGVSGIYKGHDYSKGRYEKPPYSDSSIRSVYHVRNLEVFRMKQLAKGTPLDIFLSHDWPMGVTKYGDAKQLCRQKPFFKKEVESDSLGSRAAEELLHTLKPKYWFAGHLHVKFAALVGHQALTADNSDAVDKQEDTKDESNTKSKNVVGFTRFLALDKCLPRREFLQILDIKYGRKHLYQNPLVVSTPSATEVDSTTPIKDQCSYSIYDDEGVVQLYHDLEWLTVLRLTDHLQKVTQHCVYMPGPKGSEPYQFTPSEADLKETLRLMNNDLCIRKDQFARTAPAFDPMRDTFALQNIETVRQPEPVLHPYTDDLCKKLGISEPIALLMKLGKQRFKQVTDMTPKTNSNAAEKNVNNGDSPHSEKEPDCVSSSNTGADIIFEVSISSDSDGTSKGLLSPAISSMHLTSTGARRKALTLSSPQHSSAEPPSSSPPSLLDSPLSKPLSSDPSSPKVSDLSPTSTSAIITSSSEESGVPKDDSSQRSLSSTSSPSSPATDGPQQPSVEGKSLRRSMTLSRPVNDPQPDEHQLLAPGDVDTVSLLPADGEPPKPSLLSSRPVNDPQPDEHQLPTPGDVDTVSLLPADGEPPKSSLLSEETILSGNTEHEEANLSLNGTTRTPSPKRLLENVDEQVQGCEPKPETPVASVAPKPSKIRRRNAAVYTAPSED